MNAAARITVQVRAPVDPNGSTVSYGPAVSPFADTLRTAATYAQSVGNKATSLTSI